MEKQPKNYNKAKCKAKQQSCKTIVHVAAKTKKEQKNPKSKFQTECSSKKERRKKKKKKNLPAGEKICRRQSWTGMRSAGRQRTPDAERERRREGRTPDAERERRIWGSGRRRERELDLPERERRTTESGGAGAGERDLWRGSAGDGFCTERNLRDDGIHGEKFERRRNLGERALEREICGEDLPELERICRRRDLHGEKFERERDWAVALLREILIFPLSRVFF
jgi:hypothetical protein